MQLLRSWTLGNYYWWLSAAGWSLDEAGWDEWVARNLRWLGGANKLGCKVDTRHFSLWWWLWSMVLHHPGELVVYSVDGLGRSHLLNRCWMERLLLVHYLRLLLVVYRCLRLELVLGHLMRWHRYLLLSLILLHLQLLPVLPLDVKESLSFQ